MNKDIQETNINEESLNAILAKTWGRAIEPINKSGYMDGAANGQSATFQSSFDVGYSQGFMFGLQLGINGAIKSLQNQRNHTFNDINCQLCHNGGTQNDHGKVDNLFNLQEEANMNYLN